MMHATHESLQLEVEQRKELFLTFYMQIFYVLIRTAATTISSLAFFTVHFSTSSLLEIVTHFQPFDLNTYYVFLESDVF